jgi:translation initiation factor IF-3
MQRDFGPRMNERIRIREVRVIDETGAQLGILPTRDALDLARSKGLDLLEVSPTANPPVCKIMDYGKFKYDEQKKKRDTQKKSKTTEIRGIRLRPGTDEHDIQYKVRDAHRFLKEGDKVQVTLIFRSREASHPEIGRAQLARLAEGTSDIAVVEQAPTLEGRRMTMLLAPK